VDPAGLHPPLSELKTRICPSSRIFLTVHNKLFFYGDKLLAPRPSSKLDDHPFLAVRYCLFIIFAATFQYLETVSICSLWTRHAVVTGEPRDMSLKNLVFVDRATNVTLFITYQKESIVRFVKTSLFTPFVSSDWFVDCIYCSSHINTFVLAQKF
jgi:hypothetical protein